MSLASSPSADVDSSSPGPDVALNYLLTVLVTASHESYHWVNRIHLADTVLLLPMLASKHTLQL